MFAENFRQFENDVDAEVRNAGPVRQAAAE
jgi:hypothetical protein